MSGAKQPECDVCAYEREECGCWEWDEDGCAECGGTGERVPVHCWACGGGEYDCICCPSCGVQNIGRCPCTLTVQLAEGGTLALPGADPDLATEREPSP